MEDSDSVEKMVIEKKELPGTSRYDHINEMWRCCRCDEAVALSFEDEKRFVDREVQEWHRTDPLLPRGELARIERRVQEREAGHRISPNQVIHDRCLIQLTESESEFLRNKARFPLPLPAERYEFFRIAQKQLEENHYRCGYCQDQIDAFIHYGFAYRNRDGSDKTTSYLHDVCFVDQVRAQKGDLRGPVERYHAPPHLPQTTDPLTARKKNLEWADYLARFEADRQSREAYLAWRKKEAVARSAWTPDQLAQWETYDKTLPEKYDENELYASEDARVQTLDEVRQEVHVYTYPLQSEKRREATLKLNMIEIRSETQ